jgi:NADP-dependent 3-hydroxy acid dehydrogenase YdfG
MAGRVLVTGAASGLGRAIATRFAREGRQVLLTDIDTEALSVVETELSKIGTVAARRLDVLDDSDWLRARQWCEDTWGGLDLLVNNAGVLACGRMELIPMEDWDWIIELNLKSVIRGCRTFVPMFKRQGSGYLVNVASVAGVANLPVMASYNVSKAAVISLSQTLRYELAPYGIGTTVICPGVVKTNIVSSMRSPDPESLRAAEMVINGADVTAEQVADKVYDAVQKRRFLVLTHRRDQVLRALLVFAPRLAERLIVRRWSTLRHHLDQTPVA